MHEILISIPLLARGNCIGVMGVSYRARKTLTPAHRAMALAFADQCALALDRVSLFENEVEERRRAKFLAEATSLLSRSLEYDVVLKDLANLAVPALGDWCAIEMVDGSSTRLATVVHSDPAKVELARRVRERFPPQADRDVGVHQAIRTGKAQLHAEIPDQLLAAAVRDEEELALYRKMGMRSAIIAPLIAREKPIGAITLVWAESDRRYTHDDLDFITDLCNRAALAVENAHLYQELEKAVRARDDFMSIAGMQVRTPLAALQLRLQTTLRGLSKEPPTPGNMRLRERLQKALESGERLERLVAELLDVSRVTAGRLTLELQDLDLIELVEGIVASLTEQAAKAESEIRFSHEGAVYGRWDRARLEQVVSNLLTNALKYGRGKPVEIEVERDNRCAVVRVRDFGIGIEPVDQIRIFERFERAVSDKHFGGLGLGLWIARQVVEASGGSISVESSLGQGSLFTVKVPIDPAVEET